MKMAMVVYNEAMNDEVMELLVRCGFANYTKIERVFGKGTTSGTHLGNDIWPGINNVLYVALDDTKVGPLIEGIRGLRSRLGHEGIKAFVFPLEEIT